MYFLEEKYPKYGNIVPRDIATREIFDICINQGLGVGGGNMVFLDLTHLGREYLELKLGGILEIYRKFVGEDPVEMPMKIFPGVHYTMGGLWTQYTSKDDLHGMEPGAPNSMMTNIPGLYAFGEVNYQFHGANRLGANALLSCIFDGLFSGLGVVKYVTDTMHVSAADIDQRIYDAVVDQEQTKVDRLIGASGMENPYEIGRAMGEEMTAGCTVVKTGPRLEQTLERVRQLQERYESVGLADTDMWTNQNLAYARALGDMLKLAEVLVVGSIQRKESRGAHYRADYPERDDANFLRSTVARFDPDTGRPDLSLQPVETGLVPPRIRSYGVVDSTKQADTSRSEHQQPSATAP